MVRATYRNKKAIPCAWMAAKKEVSAVVVNEPRTSATVYGDDLAVTGTREGEPGRLFPDLHDPNYDARHRSSAGADSGSCLIRSIWSAIATISSGARIRRAHEKARLIKAKLLPVGHARLWLITHRLPPILLGDRQSC